MSKILIDIKELKGKIDKISFECGPKIAYEMIKNISKDHDIEVRINAKGMSMASMVAMMNKNGTAH